MHRQYEKDPTEFFSVVGAPYVRERVRESDTFDQRLHDAPAPRRRRLNIGIATVGAGLGAVVLGVSLFTTNGVARLGEVAFQAAGMK